MYARDQPDSEGTLFTGNPPLGALDQDQPPPERSEATRPTAAAAICSASQPKHQLQPRIDVLHDLARERLNPLCKKCPVSGID